MNLRGLVLLAWLGLASVAFFGMGTSLAEPLAINRANQVLTRNLLAAGRLPNNGCGYAREPLDIDARRVAAASSEWRKVAAIWPNASGRFRQEAQLSLLAGDWEQARLNLDKANDPVSRLQSAWLAAAQGRLTDSANSLAPDYANPLPVLLQRGNRFFESGQYEAARTCFEVAAAIDPSNADAAIGRGRSYHMIGQHQLAMADFDQEIARCPRCYQYYLYRGYLRYELGLETEAGEDFYAALTLAPEEYGVVLQWGYWLQTIGRLDEAEAPFLRAINLGPTYLEPILALAALYCRTGQPADAAALLEAAQSRFQAPADATRIRVQLGACR